MWFKYLTTVYLIFSVFNGAKTQQKVNIEILYESLCPDSIRFVTRQLYPAWKDIAPYVNIKFTPFGKSAKVQQNKHCYRAHYQLQTWLGNELTATDWGWKPHQCGIIPKFTEKELIPETLLKTICCSCETGCNSLKCGCRKHGLKCTNLCSNCHGYEKCSNVEEKTYEEINDSDETVDEEPMQTGNNIGDEDGDGLEDFEDLLESGRFVESNDEEMRSKRRKLMDK